MIGTVVGSYQIVDRVAVGGMGTVYRGQHQLIGRTAAVKVLHPELSSNRDIVNRFFNEAKATTAIHHPGIVEVFDFGYMPSGHAFLVMEYLEGVTLSQRIKLRGVMGEGEAALHLRGVCSALSAAHAKGIIHRDLKPDNIFLVPDLESPLGERCKLLDFGIAKLTDVGLAGSATKTGAVMGTPTYMSPEQCKGTGDVDARADLYSIGCMFYELVAGRPPFVNFGAGELIGSHLFVQPDPVSRHARGLSPETEALIMSLLEKQPERRVQSARELGRLLTEIAQRYVAIPLGTPYDLTRPSMGPGSMPGHATGPGQHLHTPAPLGYQTGPSHAGPTGPGVMTPAPPYIPTPAPMSRAATGSAHAAATKPTTLSGAASESLVLPPAKRSRAGIAIGAALIAALAGGAVAVFGVGGGDEITPAATGSSEPVGAPIGSAAVATPQPPQPPPEVVAPLDAAVAEPVAVILDAAPAVVEVPPDAAPTQTVRPPREPKRPPRQDHPKKPPKPGGDLLETDL